MVFLTWFDVDQAIYKVNGLCLFAFGLPVAFLLVEVQTNAIAPIDWPIHQMHKSSDIQKRQYPLRLVSNLPQFLLVLHQSFLEQVQRLQILFLVERNTEGFLLLDQLVLQGWQLRILLELKK